MAVIHAVRTVFPVRLCVLGSWFIFGYVEKFGFVVDRMSSGRAANLVQSRRFGAQTSTVGSQTMEGMIPLTDVIS